MLIQAAQNPRVSPDLRSPCDPSRHKSGFGIMAEVVQTRAAPAGQAVDAHFLEDAPEDVQ